MMTAEAFKIAFNQLIARAKLEECFNLIDSNISKSSDIWYNEILLVQGQFSELDREYNGDIIKRDDYKTERNSIQYRLLNIIKKVTDEDIVKSIEDNNTILFICRNDTDEFYIRSFCSQKKGLKYEVKQIKTYEEPIDYKFIVFDNHSIKNIENRFELKDEELAHLKVMEEYINEYSNHKRYMIHFGEMTNIVSINRDIIYSANSKFALYSRIMEMNKFIDDDCLYNRHLSV